MYGLINVEATRHYQETVLLLLSCPCRRVIARR